jgi:hypothetical protein
MEPPPAGGQAWPGRNRRRCHHDLLLFAGRAAGGGGGHVRAGTHPKGHQPKSVMAGLASHTTPWPEQQQVPRAVTLLRAGMSLDQLVRVPPTPPYAVVGRVRMMLR